ncbi:MAG TPA: hypothetical protein VH914_03110 [Acidimicrobiia bacterium]|jgi:hypothetical protein|nr:hypothetical protein [Acidimicrobiia bacterium]
MDGGKMGRRELIELLGGVAFLAACSGTSAKARGTASSGAPGSTAAGSPVTFTMNGPAQPASKRFTRAQLTRFRNQYAGAWTSAWIEEGGRRGTADATLALDVARRVATYTVTFDGPLLGGESPKPTTYVVNVDQYDATSDHAVAVTPQLGRVEVTVDGFGHVQLRATDIPDHRDIVSVDVKAVIETPTAANITYTIAMAGGSTQRGALAAAKGSTRPAYPSLDQATSATAFVTGDYAASLMTADTATRLLGEPCKTPVANGGRVAYAPGIDVSNGRVETVADSLNGSGAVIQYSVYRAPDAAAMRAFFQRYAGYRTMPDVGDAAVAYPPGTSPITIFDARKGRFGLEVTIVGGAHATPLPAPQSNARFVAVAKAIVAKLP